MFKHRSGSKQEILKEDQMPNYKCTPLPHLSDSDIARYWTKVDVGGPDDCWPWKAACVVGYGAFRVGGKTVRSHRVAIFLSSGKDPAPYLACHACDNPPCCNPAHLFTGTLIDNALDRDRKGRGVIGTKNGQSKLSERDVEEIKKLCGQKSYSEIGKLFNITPGAISMIRHGLRWKHLDTFKAAIMD